MALLSKALEKSISMSSICRLLSNALWMSAVTMSSWVSHERFLRKPCWASLRLEWLSRWHIRLDCMHNVFHQFAADGREGYRAVVRRCHWVPLFEDGNNICLEPGSRDGALVV